MKITLEHGSGGKATSDLIEKIFKKHFDNKVLNLMEDSAVVDSSKKIAITTDSFVVTPLKFPGGDIGKLAVCGTVNDLLMRAAVPKYLTCGFIIEEGLDTEILEEIVKSMQKTAKLANVTIVAGDTKVINGNKGLYINTSGVGFVKGENISSANCKEGDVVIVSGTMGDHHATILSSRMNIKNSIKSDCAPLNEMVLNLINSGIKIHAMRDITRGGLATVLNELASASNKCIEIIEEKIKVNSNVKAFNEILGLDFLTMGNEGKMVAMVEKNQAEEALKIIKNSAYGENASIIGKVTKGEGVIMHTPFGGKRKINVLYGEGLPRIC